MERQKYPTFVGRRKGHTLSPHKKTLYTSLYPTIAIPTEEKTLAAFVHGKTVGLEIGFGSGEHLFAQAKKDPAIQWLGCEPFINGFVALLNKIEQNPCTNIHLYNDDARHIIHKLPLASIDKIYILFPDPWPKKRHHKRRFINKENLHCFDKILKIGGKICFATDHTDYSIDALAHLLSMPTWAWTINDPKECFVPPKDHIPTRYEEKARAKGIPCVFYTFEKKA